MNGCSQALEIENRRSEREELFPARPVCVWVVDDNKEIRELTAGLLNVQAGGIKCARQFPSPVGILEALKRGPAPDAVLLDIHMGAHNGLDAIRPIKSLAPSTRVLILTTFLNPEDRRRAFAEGAADFLLKVHSGAEISDRIRQSLLREEAVDFISTFESGASDETGSFGTDEHLNLLYRRAPQLSSKPGAESATPSRPVRGFRAISRRCVSSLVARGVQFLRRVRWRSEPPENLPEINMTQNRSRQPAC